MNLEKIHTDKRGEVYIITDNGKEISNLLYTKEGFARGGCVHKEEEHLFVVRGRIKLFIPEKEMELSDTECVYIPANTPHYFVSFTDSIVMEAGAQQLDIKYQPYLDKINEINSSK